MFNDLNYTAVIVSTLAAFIIGFIWYGPFLGKEWMKQVGLNENDMKGPMGPPIVKGLLSTFVLVTVASYVVSLGGAQSWQDGALTGAVLGIGLIGPVLFGEVNWEQRPVKLFMINILHYIVVLAVAGGIYAGWSA